MRPHLSLACTLAVAALAPLPLMVACSSETLAQQRQPAEHGPENDPNRPPGMDEPEEDFEEEPGNDAGPSCRFDECIESAVTCFNGKDDDGDGLVDCADPSCQPKVDATLSGPLPIELHGTTVGQGNDYPLTPEPCRESPVNRDPDLAYRFTAATAGTYRFTAYHSEEDRFGVALTIASETCGTPPITCQAYDVAPGVDAPLGAGQTVLLIVDPFTGLGTGSPFVLRIEKL